MPYLQPRLGLELGSIVMLKIQNFVSMKASSYVEETSN